jgi:hypothetical protein
MHCNSGVQKWTVLRDNQLVKRRMQAESGSKLRFDQWLKAPLECAASRCIPNYALINCRAISMTLAPRVTSRVVLTV